MESVYRITVYDLRYRLRWTVYASLFIYREPAVNSKLVVPKLAQNRRKAGPGNESDLYQLLSERSRIHSFKGAF